MTRKRTRHTQITSERRRNTVFHSRLDSLLKKANELSILCGIEVGVVVHRQGESNTIQWPSPNSFGEMLSKFLQFPSGTRAKKMVLHEKYLEQKVGEETKDLMMSRKRNEEKEFHQLVHDVMEGKDFDELNLDQLSNLESFAVLMLRKLEIRQKELNDNENLSMAVGGGSGDDHSIVGGSGKE